jgi:hypothetical protein
VIVDRLCFGDVAFVGVRCNHSFSRSVDRCGNTTDQTYLSGNQKTQKTGLVARNSLIATFFLPTSFTVARVPSLSFPSSSR